MKLLFDENLSRKVVELVKELLPGSVHVTQVGLSSGTSDREIWDYANRTASPSLRLTGILLRWRMRSGIHQKSSFWKIAIIRQVSPLG
jgi:Domain of unknown function (DUF5615)